MKKSMRIVNYLFLALYFLGFIFISIHYTDLLAGLLLSATLVGPVIILSFFASRRLQPPYTSPLLYLAGAVWVLFLELFFLFSNYMEGHSLPPNANTVVLAVLPLFPLIQAVQVALLEESLTTQQRRVIVGYIIFFSLVGVGITVLVFQQGS